MFELPALVQALNYLYWASKLSLVPLGAVLNRFRGGGYGVLEGRTFLKMGITAGLVALLTFLFFPWPIAIAAGAAVVLWDIGLPWGRWYTLNRAPRILSGEPTLPERWIETVADLGGTRRDRVAFLIRNLVCFAAGGAVLAFAAGAPWLMFLVPIAAVIQSIAYELGWRLADHWNEAASGIHYCEQIFGACMGAAVALGTHLI